MRGVAESNPLDAQSVVDVSHYAVTVNGVAATVESAGYARGVVIVGLAVGSLHRGDNVVVAWNGLLDARGGVLKGQSGAIVVR